MTQKWIDLFLYLCGYGVVAWALYVLISPWYVRHATEPSCFGSNPGPQDRALNGCHDCPFRGACLRPFVGSDFQ